MEFYKTLTRENQTTLANNLKTDALKVIETFVSTNNEPIFVQGAIRLHDNFMKKWQHYTSKNELINLTYWSCNKAINVTRIELGINWVLND